ncbi:MAG: ribosome maturation factor RimP [Nitrospira sp.]|jgi:ribosome maturation factor RimP|nr:ribosome maturation factor RimP [Nitrospira sp.]MDH4243083.1 ribosome maturation factor RimP [Nitrospira sp.]MDH4356914.1 ribosome maturation factor RimP [Nitrospira sp.]MDH5317341.1 ribosome maturation factor RimP [Nitrospira sp.]
MPGNGSEPVADRLQKIVSPILWTLGLELVDVICVGQGSRSVVRVLISKPGGVTITDCEQAHKALGPALDVADPFPHAYTLEVSSPGLDRPFKRLQDYQRAIGKEVSLKLRQPLEGQWKITGRLMNADEQAVVLDLIMSKMTKSIRLDREVIAEAKLVVKL